MTIERELLALMRPDGTLHAADVHSWAAANPESRLHATLEWDNAKAGYEYRLNQIRQLIRIHIVDVTGERETISLSIDRVANGGYREIDMVIRDAGLREVALSDALADLKRVKHKYARLLELAEVWEAVEAVKAKHRAEPKPSRPSPAGRSGKHDPRA